MAPLLMPAITVMSDIKDTSTFQGKIHDLDEAVGKKILVLEDDVAMATSVRVRLEAAGYEVECVSDGVEGIKKVMENDYAVILCDMVMPNLSGDMFYVAVERVKPYLCRRFLFMTGYKGDRKVEEFIQRVNGLILWKPFESDDLMEAIQAVESKGPD
jgi:CheY-like chemotaxis protein